MGRTVNPWLFGRPGFCNVCGKPCCTMDQVDIRCYHCGQGSFVHRMYWHQVGCTCGSAPGCPRCGGCGVIAIPREDDTVWEYEPGRH